MMNASLISAQANEVARDVLVWIGEADELVNDASSRLLVSMQPYSR